MSSIPLCIRRLYLFYSPQVHKPQKQSLFGAEPKDVPTPCTPWLRFSKKSALGVELDPSKAPTSTSPPPPLDDDNLIPMNAWIHSTRGERLLYWVCKAIIQSFCSSTSTSTLEGVGLLSSMPLRLPSMLPVWLALDNILPATQSGIYLSPADLAEETEISQRALSIREMRHSLQSKSNEIHNDDERKQVVMKWAEQVIKGEEDMDESTLYRLEMAQWLVKDEALVIAVAKVY